MFQELESRLDDQISECGKLRNQASHLQKSLEDSLEWKNRFESSFSERESELESRIRQLERELRQTAETKLELQQQLSEVNFRETEHLNKYETLMIQMQEAVAKLEKENRQLSETKSLEATASAKTLPHKEAEELKQKINFLEAQITKLDQQLEKSRENLTLVSRTNLFFKKNLEGFIEFCLSGT